MFTENCEHHVAFDTVGDLEIAALRVRLDNLASNVRCTSMYTGRRFIEFR